jgi:hypothetical protein
MSDEKFVVGCEGIGFHGGVVLLDLVGLSTTNKDAEGRPLREPRLRLIMTPDGMLETMNAMQGMVNRLLEVGLIKRADAPAGGVQQNAEPGASAEAPASPELGGQPKSPNFN